MSSPSSAFHQLPPDLLPVIFSYLTPHDCFRALPLLCSSFPPVTPTAFKATPLVVTIAVLHRLAASSALRSVLSLTPHLSLDLRADLLHSASIPVPPCPSLLPPLLPHLLPHISDSFLLLTLSEHFTQQPRTAVVFALFALLSWTQPFLRLSSLSVHDVSGAETLAVVHLSPLSFPSLTSLTLGGLMLDDASLSPLLTLPALLHLDLSQSSYAYQRRTSLSKLLLSSGASMWLRSLSVPNRDFWGRLDSIIACIGQQPTRGLRSNRTGRGQLTHFQPSGHVSAVDFSTLAGMATLESLSLDGCEMFAAGQPHLPPPHRPSLPLPPPSPSCPGPPPLP